MENINLNTEIINLQTELESARTAVSAAEASLERAKLEYDDAEDDYEKIKKLYEEGAATKQELKKAELRLKTSEKKVKEQKLVLDRAISEVNGIKQSLKQYNLKKGRLVITSPVKGEIIRLPVDKNQIVQSGSLLASVFVPGNLEIRAEILSDDLSRIDVGQKVEISSAFLGDRTLEGKVKKIYPRAEEKKSPLGVVQRRVPVIISLTDLGKLKPGYEVDVSIQTERKENVIVIPREAAYTLEGNKKKVMIVQDDRVQHRVITTGITGKEKIEVIEGLQKGETIIKDSSIDLSEGSRVKIVE